MMTDSTCAVAIERQREGIVSLKTGFRMYVIINYFK